MSSMDPSYQPYPPPPGMEPYPPGMEPYPPGMAPLPPPPPKTITSGGVVAMVGGLMMLISIALPWKTVSGGPLSVSVNFFDMISNGGFGEILIYSIIGLIMGILAIVLALAKRPAGSAVCGVIGLIMFIVAMIRLGWTSVTLSGITISETPGYGVYLGVIGALLAMIGGAVGHKQM